MATKKSSKTERVLNVLTKRIMSDGSENQSSEQPPEQQKYNQPTAELQESVQPSIQEEYIQSIQPVQQPAIQQEYIQPAQSPNPVQSPLPPQYVPSPPQQMYAQPAVITPGQIEYNPVMQAPARQTPAQKATINPATRFRPNEVAELIRGNLEMVNSFENEEDETDNLSEDNLQVVNIMVEIVSQKIPDFISKLGGCTCAKCRADALAYALNLLPARYVVTQKGRLFAHLSAAFIQSNTDISSAITRACIHVFNHPQHGDI